MNQNNTLPIPLLTALLGCCAGIAWQDYTHLLSHTHLLGLFVAVLPLVIYARRSALPVLQTSTVFFVCMLGSACIYEIPIQLHAQLVERYRASAITLVGTVADSHVERFNNVVTLENIHLTTHATQEHPTWFSRAQLSLPRSHQTPPGSIIHVKNIYLKHLPNDVRTYCLKQHLLGFFFPAPCTITITFPDKTQRSWVENQKDHLNRSTINVFPPTTQTMVKSIFLGNSQTFPNEIRLLFETWGISHFLARSGLHLIVLAGVMAFLFSLLALPGYLTRGIVVALSIIYHLVTTPSTSFWRALMTNLIIGGAVFLGTTPTMLHLFSLVTLTTLLNNPYALFSLDFQLSFGISGALIYLFSIVRSQEPSTASKELHHARK